MSNELGHAITVEIAVPADTALAYLTDPIALGRWTLGSTNTRVVSQNPELIEGQSRFDGSRSLIRIDAEPARGLVDYRVGPAGQAQALQMRISARVLDGAAFGYAAGHCLVTLTAWRPIAMSNERWQRLCAAHEVEVLLLKAQLETALLG